MRLLHGQGFTSWLFQDDPEELHKNEAGLFGSSKCFRKVCCGPGVVHFCFNELGYCTNQKGH